MPVRELSLNPPPSPTLKKKKEKKKKKKQKLRISEYGMAREMVTLPFYYCFLVRRLYNRSTKNGTILVKVGRNVWSEKLHLVDRSSLARI